MSIQNHPNFQAAGFAAEIVASYYKSLRGKANAQNHPEVRDEILQFVEKIEEMVDAHITKNQKPPEVICISDECTSLSLDHPGNANYILKKGQRAKVIQQYGEGTGFYFILGIEGVGSGKFEQKHFEFINDSY